MATMPATVAMDTLLTENLTTYEPQFDEGVNVWGLIGVIFFYLLVLFVGIYASWRNKSLKSQDSETTMLAGRSIGILVGSFTMTGESNHGNFQRIHTIPQNPSQCSLNLNAYSDKSISQLSTELCFSILTLRVRARP